ncbi:Ig-like domain-containing protein [Roseburia faecis]|jgi:hypothetical protein|uniref:Ig-like domain-containing protein n=1 Tax=Roseburia faecis TaxID=301302 RepID=UPI00189DE8CA|nr:Ig-like domain-containing protein [Roseburia faecis]
MKQMKKLLAFVLAFAMIITIYQPSAVYAAAKKPGLSAKTMTLQVGQKKTLKVKNAGKKAKLKWSSNKKSIATVSKKGVVKAVKAGNAIVTCKVTTKNGKTTKLTCKVAVKKTAKVTSLTVGSQKELEKALKNKNVTKITVATQGAVTFTVPQGDYSKVELVINAPNADVVNNGKFKSIDIQAIKPNTYRENAKGNVITVSATGDARVIVETGATVEKIMVSGSKGNVKLVVDGTLSGITIDAPVNVTVEGKTTAAVPVTVNEKAAGANVTSSTPVEVKAAAPIALNLTKGAEGSKVETTSDKAEVTVKNETTQAVTVTTPAGSKDVAKDTTSKVDNAGKVTEVADNTDVNNNNGGGTAGGGSSSGGSSGGNVTPTETITLNALHVFARNQMDVELQTKITDKDKIVVTDEKGNIQKVAEIKDMNDDSQEDEEDGWQRYMITFTSNLESGKYVFTYVSGNKKYQGDFDFAEEDLAKTESAAGKIKTNIFDKTYDIVATGENDTSVAGRQINKVLGEYAQANDFWAAVLGNYSDTYDNKSGGKAGLKITIRVQGGDSDVLQDVDGIVYFTFTKEPMAVTAPAISYKTKTSIVVKAEEDQEYICCEADKEITQEDDWENTVQADRADEFGNIEFDKLSIGKSYRIWTRNIEEADVEEKSDEITLTEKNPQIVCLADSDEKVLNLGTVTTSEEDDRVIQIPRSVKISNYGQVPENMYLHGETDNVVLMKDGQKIESDVSVSLPHSDLAEVYSVDGFEKGEYTLTYDYYYCCSDNTTHQRAVGSQAVTYQVTFTIE